MSDWISVEDKLPEIDEDVLIYGIKEDEKEIHVFLGWISKVKEKYRKEFLQWNDYESGEYGGPTIPEKVTHWMPLPEPPNEKKHEHLKDSWTMDIREVVKDCTDDTGNLGDL